MIAIIFASSELVIAISCMRSIFEQMVQCDAAPADPVFLGNLSCLVHRGALQGPDLGKSLPDHTR